jgi:plastocyanin
MTRRLSTTLFVLAALALAGLGACGGGSKKSCPATVDTKTVTGGAITVCAADTRFDVKTIKAASGPLTVTLVNHGALLHTLEIKKTSLDLSTNPGKSATGTVALAKGTYAFECTVAGHADAGMKGTIVVG